MLLLLIDTFDYDPFKYGTLHIDMNLLPLK